MNEKETNSEREGQRDRETQTERIRERERKRANKIFISVFTVYFKLGRQRKNCGCIVRPTDKTKAASEERKRVVVAAAPVHPTTDGASLRNICIDFPGKGKTQKCQTYKDIMNAYIM